jgi:Cdc6-like AAA superfamily ATPase
MLMGAHEQLLTRSSKGPEYLLMGAHEQQTSKLIYVFNDNELKLRKYRNNPKLSRNDTERKHTLSAGFRSSRFGRR